MLCAVRFSKKDLAVATQLKWLHLTSAGATHVLFPELIESEVIVTNSRGLYGIPIAEHVLGMMLMFARRLHEAYRLQGEGKWARQEMLNRFSLIAELHGRTVGIIGLGSIGLAVAERCQAFGMRVVANKRRGGDKPACVDELLGPNDLPRLLAQSDYVVVAAPLTPETRGLIGEPELRLMKPGAFILNVGRGAIIQEAALIQALKEDRLGGAGLDVTDPEPPEADSKLFHLPTSFSRRIIPASALTIGSTRWPCSNRFSASICAASPWIMSWTSAAGIRMSVHSREAALGSIV